MTSTGSRGRRRQYRSRVWRTHPAHVELGEDAFALGQILADIAIDSPVYPELRGADGRPAELLAIALDAHWRGDVRFLEARVTTALEELISVGTLERGADGVLRFSGDGAPWLEDANTKYVYAHRERRRAAGAPDPLPADDTATASGDVQLIGGRAEPGELGPPAGAPPEQPDAATPEVTTAVGPWRIPSDVLAQLRAAVPEFDEDGFVRALRHTVTYVNLSPRAPLPPERVPGVLLNGLTRALDRVRSTANMAPEQPRRAWKRPAEKAAEDEHAYRQRQGEAWERKAEEARERAEQEMRDEETRARAAMYRDQIRETLERADESESDRLYRETRDALRAQLAPRLGTRASMPVLSQEQDGDQTVMTVDTTGPPHELERHG